MRRPAIFTASAVALSLFVIALPANGDDPSGPVGADVGAFHADCQYTHRLADDPIVAPRGSGASHSHDFFGSRSTDAFSTNDSIRSSASTCVRTNASASDADHSAYWVPTLYVGDQPVDPVEPLGAYYKAGRRDFMAIKSFPKDLRIIAGDAKGLTPDEINGQRVFIWECEGTTVDRGSTTIAPTCTQGLTLSIRFPDCWDGINVDSSNHKSHMAYSTEGARAWVCPSTHPVLVPRLELKVRYPTTGGPAVRLASGAVNTAHADFMNGWNQETLEALVRDCLNTDEYCGGGEKPVPGHAGNGDAPAPAGGSGGTAGQPGFRRVRSRPKVTRDGKWLRVDTGLATVCPSRGAGCRVTLGAYSGNRRVATARSNVAAGATHRLGFTLGSKPARALNRSKRMRVTVRLRATLGDGPAKTLSRVLVLKAPR